MPRNRKYHPDYSALYPGVDIPPEALAALRQSDRKMKYMEYDLKAERPVKDGYGNIVALLPGLEDSLERLMELDRQFVDDAPSPEQIVMEREEADELRRCIALLSKEDQALIHALFVDRLTEQEYARRIGVSQPRVSQLWSRARNRLKKLLKNY